MPARCTTHDLPTPQTHTSSLHAPLPIFNGTDSFTYKATDGTADSNVATVSLTITAVNDAPVAANDSYSTGEDTPLTVTAPGVLATEAHASEIQPRVGTLRRLRVASNSRL